ncbi:hypothetical protein DPEC_G00172840 [Dallia pectoralis]|uniref:Uncharacterized protein n=1 Tax=Dallia pectoralis TaxID=75939 RepID=A0ACC2GDS9_DALPE|nr:hypothetical protein DPEC_G00172840 [Dallia pectoralis]
MQVDGHAFMVLCPGARHRAAIHREANRTRGQGTECERHTGGQGCAQTPVLYRTLHKRGADNIGGRKKETSAEEINRVGIQLRVGYGYKRGIGLIPYTFRSTFER